MMFSNEPNRRIFLSCCVLLVIGVCLSSFAALNAARQKQPATSAPQKFSKFEQEQTKRAEGLRFRRLSLQDAQGVIDPNGLRKARQHIEAMKTVQAERSLKRQGRIEEAAVAPDSWTWLGPGNIGGRIRSISIHPANANDILVGSVSGGIWRTFNGGAAWFPVNDFMANLAVSTLVRHPTNANLLYAGTGEGVGNVDAIQGAGVFRSDDGGVTWNQLAATNNPNFNFVNRLAISPLGTTLLAATNTGIWRSTNGGTNWTPVTFGQALDLDFDPLNANRVLVGELGRARLSRDAGQTWEATTFNPPIMNGGTAATDGRVELAYGGNSLVLYAVVNQAQGRVYRSFDGGQSFFLTSTPGHLGVQGWYNNALWVNPFDENSVVIGGIQLARSTDGGASFVPISDGSDSAHADHHAIVAHPGFNNGANRTVFFGNDGGIYRAGDVTSVTSDSGWTELNNNLGITQFYGAAGNQATGTIIGGTQDNGTLRFTGGTENWTSTAGADGGFCAADPSNASFFYGERQNLAVFRSSDFGVSSTQIISGLSDAPAGQTNFIAPLVLDRSEPTRLLAGGWSLWRTNDARGAATWNSIKAPTGGNSPISAIAISPNNSDFIVVGHNNGDIYLTFNGTAAAPTWSPITTAAFLNKFVTRLVIDTTRGPNWIYATFGGFSADNVYVSKNFGVSWTDMTGTGFTALPDVPVRSLVIHPVNNNLLYVGTEVGIFTSDDAGASWDLPHGGPANVSVDELFWLGGDLVAATHGRGLFRASGGIYVDCNYIGTQSGTLTQPYRTIGAAIAAVTRYQPIWIRPCTYIEALPPISKRLEMRSLGGSVIIRRP